MVSTFFMLDTIGILLYAFSVGCSVAYGKPHSANERNTIMSSEWTTFPDGAKFNPGDTLVSPQRLYYCALDADGSFSIYRGDPRTAATTERAWSTNTPLPAGWSYPQMLLRKGPWNHGVKNLQLVAQGTPYLQRLWESGGSSDVSVPMSGSLRDDGRLVLQQNNHEVWSNGFSDPVVEYVVKTITYDIPSAKIKKDSPHGTLEQELDNTRSDIPQHMKVSKGISTSVTSTWSNATGFSATVGGEVTAGVPGVASSKVSFSASVSNTFTFGRSDVKTQSLTWEFDLTAPPKKRYKGIAEINEAEFEVPYTVVGELHFKSGYKLSNHSFSGIYAGKNSYLGLYSVVDVTDPVEKHVLSRNILVG